MKKLPIGIQTFEKLITDGYVYVDKTRYIYDLIMQGDYYFLARPRRFGKSLLVSTLAAIFEGKKELFEGLAISALPYEWKQHPVIMLSLSDIPCTDENTLEGGLRRYLCQIAQDHGVTLTDDIPSGELLRSLVKELAKKERVVLLIDEYDYPILKHVHKPEDAERIREALRNFYTVIKGLDAHLKFVLLTGVSRFSRTSIFSGLNNLEDITLSSSCNALLGYTKEEIRTHFDGHLHQTADEMGYSVEDLLDHITEWYDGYKFSAAMHESKLYNPFSVLLFLKKRHFSNYWFETGTPTFLINLLKSKYYPMQDLESVEVTAAELSQFDVDNIELKTLLFQTGYLTIKSYDREARNYVLGYVNKETIDSLGEHIIKSMTGVERASVNKLVALLYKAFRTLNFDHIKHLLTQFFAAIPYTIQIAEEKYYQTIFYLILKMIGADIIVEQPTNIGRIDAVLQTKDHCFIIEFKINATAQKALEQIEAKKYYQSYESLGKKIVLVGIAFDTQERNVSGVEFRDLHIL